MQITKEDRLQLKRVLKGLGRRKTKETIFYDLCFCLCAPQTTFKNNRVVIKLLKKENFYKDHVCDLRHKLKPVRFYNNKASYLLEMKINFNDIYKIIKNKELSGYEKREWLVKNVKGTGMKVASHFLRNIGHDELAIIDTHIIKFMARDSYFDPIDIVYLKVEEVETGIKKKITKPKGYEEIESWFQEIAGNYKLITAELDALVWKNYSGTEWENFIF